MLEGLESERAIGVVAVVVAPPETLRRRFDLDVGEAVDEATADAAMVHHPRINHRMVNKLVTTDSVE